MENNFREILFLIEQIDVLKALLRDMQNGLHSYSWNPDGDPTEVQNHTEVMDEVRWVGGVAGSVVNFSFWCHIPWLLCMEKWSAD